MALFLKAKSCLKVSVVPIQNHRLCTQITEDEKEKELRRIAQEASIDEPPSTCCGTGCANCVYIAWAEALSAKMENAGPDIVKKIINRVEDPSMKAFLEMELRIQRMKS